MMKMMTAIALSMALPAVAHAQAAPAPAPKEKDCCEKMKAEGKKCCCDDMDHKDHADMKGGAETQHAH